MNNLSKTIKSNAAILVILICSVFLRFYRLFNIPFTHDEFSTLFRTNFRSFDELIQKGVKIDGHPAGLQVFVYYFKMLFGSEEWVLKIPFLIFGIASVWLIYVIYTKWYNKTVGLISAAFLATLQYTVMYSQIARPYISGMFFVLALVYFWNALFIEKKHRWFNYVGYVLVADLCLYNHHFSALMAVIISITGLFFVDRKTSWKFIVTGLGILLLYVPHISILKAQLALKGLGWLTKPTLLFVRDYFCYLGQFSWVTLFLCLILLGMSVFRFQKTAYFSRITLVSFLWFVLPFTIGYLYSLYRAPLLQYSILIFSFPFLLPVLFGGISSFSNKVNIGIVILILGVNSLVLIFHRKHYTLFYESIYKEIVLNATNQNSKSKILIFDASGTDKDIIEHYISKWKVKLPFRWMDSFQTLGDFRTYIQSIAKENGKVFFGAMYDSRPTLIPIIQEFFPNLEKREDYVSGSTFLFTKGKAHVRALSAMYFDRDVVHWSSLAAYKPYIQTGNFYMDSTLEYSLGYTGLLSELIPKGYDILDVSLRIKVPTATSQASIVTTVDSPSGSLDWRSTNFSEYVDSTHVKSVWIEVKHSIYLTESVLNTPDAKLGIYIWNAAKERFCVNDIQISIRKDNPIKYGLYYPVK